MLVADGVSWDACKIVAFSFSFVSCTWHCCYRSAMYVFYASIFALDLISLSLSLSILILHINCACNAAKGPWSNWKFISLAFFVSLSLPRIIPRSVLSFESYYLVGTHAVIMTKFIQHTALTYHSWSGFQPMHAATHVSKFNPFRSSFNLLLFVHIAHPFFISIAHSLFIPN